MDLVQCEHCFGQLEDVMDEEVRRLEKAHRTATGIAVGKRKLGGIIVAK